MQKRKCVLSLSTGGRPQPCNVCRKNPLQCTYDLLCKTRGPRPKPYVTGLWSLDRLILTSGCSHDVLVRPPNEKNVHDLDRALDAFCPKKALHFLIYTSMDHPYLLTPVVHKPTFFARLNERVHFHDPAFFSLLIAVIFSTVCIMPGMIQSCTRLDPSFTHANRKKCWNRQNSLSFASD